MDGKVGTSVDCRMQMNANDDWICSLSEVIHGGLHTSASIVGNKLTSDATLLLSWKFPKLFCLIFLPLKTKHGLRGTPEEKTFTFSPECWPLISSCPLYGNFWVKSLELDLVRLLWIWNQPSLALHLFVRRTKSGHIRSGIFCGWRCSKNIWVWKHHIWRLTWNLC